MQDCCECLRGAHADEDEQALAEGFQYCEIHPDTVIPCRACLYVEKD